MRRAPMLALALAGLAACKGDPQTPAQPAARETTVPKDVEAVKLPAPSGEEAQIGTPLAARVATLGLLNKRNNLSEDITLKPGEVRRVGDVIVKLQSCERTAPWELPKETGAFVQVLVQERSAPGSFRKIFSGWLFKESPSLNVVEHPIYDVWIKDCAMSFPGEEAAAKRDSAAGSEEPAEPRAAATSET